MCEEYEFWSADSRQYLGDLCDTNAGLGVHKQTLF